ncbi:MAG: N-acetylneuraminate synthase [Oscillospiraceae bacterium]|nr:N-acetylneuraminate synthase [Oscillospiraceae bacterium]
MNSYIIAEAGVNHNGSIKLAKELVDAAKDAGADCIKFQTFIPEKLVSKSAIKADYQKVQTGHNESQLDMLRNLALSYDEFRQLHAYCGQKGIEFLSTPFDNESVEFLHSLGMATWKIPSGEITNLPFLVKIANFGQRVILSTGMSSFDEVRQTVDILRKNGADNLTVLHCTTEYPAPFADVNLTAMTTMGNHLNVPIGYSDHTQGYEVAVAAAALGASVIEKHFTLDKTMVGPDHKASLDPMELAHMINAIRNVEEAMGTGIKEVTQSEIRNIAVARKSIVAKRDIRSGEVFTVDNITVKRPGTGISPMKWFDVLGASAIRNFEEDELIEI